MTDREKEQQDFLDRQSMFDLQIINGIVYDERQAVIKEIEGWLVDEDLSEHESDSQCPECSGMWNYDHAKSRNRYRAELRAKLAEMKKGKCKETSTKT